MRILAYIVLTIAAMLAMPPLVAAAESQFYFVGKVVVSADPVPGATHIYLRWDEVEGQLPGDVVTFRLLRNGEVAGEWPAGMVMSGAEIDALYAGTDHQRRKLETITRLNELASEEGRAFSTAQFSSLLFDLVNPAPPDPNDPAAFHTYNPLWAFLGSRTDFNIARARHRAWIDTAPVIASGRSVVEYELLGVNAADVEVRLGYIEIDPTQRQQALGASALRQIRISDWQCDLPGNSKDQFTVMLDWQSPGASNTTDRVAAQSYISGFDLYRTTDNLDPAVVVAPPRDIAALAAAASFDNRGRPEIAGLEKVNDSLIIDSGAPATDPGWLEAMQYHLERVGGDPADLPAVAPANIPVQPKWLEARDQLIRAGLRPGDRRAYYLVPRDFAGEYGPTAATVVEVPLMSRPPAPWNLRTFADETSSAPGEYTITWDEVDLDNYMKMYQGTRLFCNALEARTTGVLEYVANSQSCDTSPRFAIRLDVVDYRIYRFTDFDVAGRFMDSDGDGVENSAETPDFDGNDRIDAFERSAGLQCDASMQPPGADNYLVYSKEGGSVVLGRDRIFNPLPPNRARMRDVVPAGNKDTVYWYRVVAEAALLPSDVDDEQPPFVGRLSFMSAPQRALFPDRDPPPPPIVGVTRPGPNIDGCELSADPDAPWSFVEDVSDPKAGGSFSLNCSAGAYTAADVQQAGQGACPQIVNDCGGTDNVLVTFTNTSLPGNKACTVAVPDDVSFCEMGGISIDPAFERVNVAPGDLVAGGVEVNVSPPSADTCIAVFENIDGSVTRIGSTCDPGGLRYVPRPGQFCGYAVATDENNNISATVQFPCTLTPPQPKAPSAPQILTLDVDNDFARFTFRLPAEQVAMTMARLVHEVGGAGAARTVEPIPVIDNEPGESIIHSISVDALQGTRDRFCLSLMAIGRDDGSGDALNSEWSTERCFARTAIGEDIPTYLPWPAVQGATQGPDLQATLVTDFRQLRPFLAFLIIDAPGLVDDLGQPANIESCWMEQPAVPEELRRDFDTFHCFAGGVARFRAAMAAELKFIVYRQSRVSGGQAFDWVQVSPLIDYVHLDRQTVTISDRDHSVWTLNDPYIKTTARFIGIPRLTAWFVDQYPFFYPPNAPGPGFYEWRYQVVYFDDAHRPVEWRATDWFAEDE